MKKLTILLTLFVMTQAPMAYKYHDPKAGVNHSHNHNDDSQTARIWKYEDKSIAAKGTFLLAKSGNVFIEKQDGIISFPIAQLSWVDQKYVNQQLKEEEAIERKSSTSLFAWPRFSFRNQTVTLIILNLIFILSLSLIWLNLKWSTITLTKQPF